MKKIVKQIVLVLMAVSIVFVAYCWGDRSATLKWKNDLMVCNADLNDLKNRNAILSNSIVELSYISETNTDLQIRVEDLARSISVQLQSISNLMIHASGLEREKQGLIKT